MSNAKGRAPFRTVSVDLSSMLSFMEEDTEHFLFTYLLQKTSLYRDLKVVYVWPFKGQN